MSDYVPSTEDVRSDATQLMNADDFDRWLKQVKAEAWDEGFADGVNHDLGDWENAPSIIKNPYRQEAGA